LDDAMAQYAMDNKVGTGTIISFDDLKNYLKTGTVLYSGSGTDLFGNPYGPFVIDQPLGIPDSTVNILSDIL